MLLDLIASRGCRGVACAPPCPWCGGDGSEGSLRGATLQSAPALDRSKPIERLGAWLLVPPSLDALRVVLSGEAVASGVIAPTAVRVRGSDAQDLWRGAPLSDLARTDASARFLTARLGGLGGHGRAGDELRVIELAGLCRAEGEGEVTMRFVAEGVGCLVCRARVRVTDGAEPRLHGVYSTSELSCAAQAWPVARFVDAVVGLVRRCGHDPSGLSLRAARTTRGTLVARVPCGATGLTGAAWRETLRSIARGGCASVSLYDPAHPDAMGIEIAPRARGRAEPLELSAWMDASEMTDAGPARWREEITGSLGPELSAGARVGLWREPVRPRFVEP